MPTNSTRDITIESAPTSIPIGGVIPEIWLPMLISRLTMIAVVAAGADARFQFRPMATTGTRAAASTRHGRATRDPCSPCHGLPGWRLNGPGEDILIFHRNDRGIRIPVRVEDGSYELTLPSGSVRVSGELLEHGDLHAVIAGRKVSATVTRYAANLEVFLGGEHLRLRSEDHDRPSARTQPLPGQLAAPMPGRVISVLVAQGEPVERGQPVMVIEAMKMEHTIRAPADGVVAQVSFVEGELVEEGAELLAIDQAGEPSSTSTKASE